MSRTIKIRFIIIILSIISIVFLILYLRELKYNSNVNNYLSEQTKSDIFDFASSVQKSDQLIDSALQSGKITIGDANLLGAKLIGQSHDFNNMVNMEEIENKGLDHRTDVASYLMSIYISKGILNASIDVFDLYATNANQVIVLNNKQKSKFNTFKNINDSWVAIIKKDVKGVSADEDIETSFYKFCANVNYTYWFTTINDFVECTGEINANTLNSLSTV
jgi:hypothetical protein